MRNQYIFILLFFAFAITASAQTWTLKGASPSKRANGIAFSIGTKGYVGLGTDSTNYLDDLWEYNPASNSWTQKANYPGLTRTAASAFSIGTKAYVVGGYAPGYNPMNEMWVYDSGNNSWTTGPNFPGTGRLNAIAFSIGNMGYYGTGVHSYLSTNVYDADFWQFDPATSTWTQKATVGGSATAGARSGAMAFVINGKGYVGMGYNSGFLTDFWEYDPANDVWAAKAWMNGGYGNIGAVGFSVGNKGYLAGGYYATDQAIMRYTFEYDPANDNWTQTQMIPTAGKSNAQGFAVNGKGYICGGYNETSYMGDLFEFDPNNLSGWWLLPANAPGERRDAFSFVIANKGYVGTGINSSGNYYSDFWEYNPDSDIWTQKAAYPGGYTSGATGFAVAGKGYAGTGYYNGTWKKDFYEYNATTNTWTQKADFGGGLRTAAVSFAAAGLGYLGTGINASGRFKDMWAYNPSNNTWTQKNNTGGPARSSAVAFNAGNKVYLGTGWDGTTSFKDFWEYNAANDTWIQKADFGGSARRSAIGFGIGSKAYIGTGINDVSELDDIWEYNPVTNTWITRENFTGTPRYDAITFSFASRTFVGTGGNSQTAFLDFWEFYPFTLNLWQIAPAYSCAGDSITLSFWSSKPSLPLTFQLSNAAGSFASPVTLKSISSSIGNNTTKIRIPPATLKGTGYLIRIVSGTDTSNLSDPILVGMFASTVTTSKPGLCNGDTLLLQASATAGLSYQWLKNNAVLPGSNNASLVVNSPGAYKIVIAASASCRDTSAAINISQYSRATAGFTINNTTQCLNGNSFTFTDTSSGIGSRGWNFGTAADDTSSLNPPVKNYSSAGNFTIKLVNTSTNGCKDSASQTVLVKPSPPKPVITVSGSTLTSSATTGNQWYDATGVLNGQTNQNYNAPGPGNYHTVVTVNGCSTSSDTIHFSAAAIAEIKASVAFIYPNPNNGAFSIILNKAAAGIVHISITDITGRLMHQHTAFNTSNIKIDNANLQTGSYFILIETGEGTVRKPLIIVK